MQGEGLPSGSQALEEHEPMASEPSEEDASGQRNEALLRALADLDNLRKRFEREVARERAAERALVAAEWLAIVDNLERALAHADDDDPVVQGLRAVRDQAVDLLARLGYPRYDTVGEPFDPARHEAVSAVESDAPPGTVVAVVRPGYGTAESTLRPASVVVSRASG
jgi:molecular chaperone GrpE